MAIHIGRRELIVTLGSTAAAWPLAARAQQSAMPVIGILSGPARDRESHLLDAFLRGLKQAGYVEGQNVGIEYRSAEGRFDRLPALAADLVRRQVAVIATLGGTITVLAAKAATTQIPIVFTVGGDPIKSGLVASLNRPGGNITGINLISGTLDAKRLEVLHEIVPKARTMAVLRNPNNPNAEPEQADLERAARSSKLDLRVFFASTPSDLDTSYSKLAEQRIDAVIVATDPFLNSRVDQLVTLAARHSLPSIYGYREFVTAGGLVSYGTSATDARRQQGIYAARILKGEKPSDLPVQQPTKVELVINLKTMKSQGLEPPLTLLARADEVIE